MRLVALLLAGAEFSLFLASRFRALTEFIAGRLVGVKPLGAAAPTPAFVALLRALRDVAGIDGDGHESPLCWPEASNVLQTSVQLPYSFGA